MILYHVLEVKVSDMKKIVNYLIRSKEARNTSVRNNPRRFYEDEKGWGRL